MFNHIMCNLSTSYFFIFRGIFLTILSRAGTKYDLDIKSPNKSGQNFKSAEDMIEMYKELCAGMSMPVMLDFLVVLLSRVYFRILMTLFSALSLCCFRVSNCVYRRPV